MKTGFFAVSLLTAASRAGAQICTSSTNTFTAHVNLHAGELGYFWFEECGNVTNPTIGIEIGQVYTFVQADRSNYMHPLGFAYFPDGAHVDKNELEPVVSEGSSTCAQTASCPAPMYFVDGQYQGSYSNIPAVAAITQDEDDFGLDAYEPLFYHPIPDWSSMEFSIQLNFSDTTYTQDIFYFCHIHSLMSGRIKLLSNGEQINNVDTPELGYNYDQPSAYDQQCGTFNLDSFQLPNDQCQETYVCDVAENDVRLQQFANCLDSMNCAMMQGMTTAANSDDPTALFIHHMIPHHQNAVNMAKALLHQNVLSCDDLTSETDDCIMENILRQIINAQNMEIQGMRGYLEEKGFVAVDDCQVDIMGHSNHTDDGSGNGVGNPGGSDGGDGSGASVITKSTCLLLLAFSFFV